MWCFDCVESILPRIFIWYTSEVRERFQADCMDVVQGCWQLERIKWHQTEIKGGKGGEGGSERGRERNRAIERDRDGERERERETEEIGHSRP